MIVASILYRIENKYYTKVRRNRSYCERYSKDTSIEIEKITYKEPTTV